MLNSDKLLFKNIIKLTKSSEKKFKQGNFKGAIEDKREAKNILNSNHLDKNLIEKFKLELSKLYNSKFDLINDHKLRIDSSKVDQIVKKLEKKSDEKYKKGDFEGAVKALRRSEKYLSY